MNLIDTTFVQLVWQQFWQCSLLVLAVYLICKSFRFRRSHLTFILWLIVLLKFMTPPIWSSSSGFFCWVQKSFTVTAAEDPTHQETRGLTLTESTRQLIGDDVKKLPDVEPNSSRMKITIHDGSAFENRNQTAETATLLPETVTALPETTISESERSARRFTFLELGLVVWSLVAVLIMGVMGLRYWRCWRIMRGAGEQHQPELEQLLARLCVELRVRRSVRLLITQSRMGPAVIGLFRPTIILPEVITQSRSLEELEPILAHELIHIRRGDLWIGLLQLLASVVWWFHPLVWFTGRRLKFEIEQCCDEEVLAELNCDPRVYATCLLEVLELKQTLNTVPVVPGVRPVEITSKRLERIMKLGQGCQKRTPWWCWMIFVMLAAVVLPGAAFVVTAADPPPKELLPSQTEEAVTSQKTKTGPIQSLPFYDELKQVANSNQRFRNMYSTDLSYLAPEIDMRDWISRTGRTRAYAIPELVTKAREAVGIMQSEKFLKQKIQARVRELYVPQENRFATNQIPGVPLFGKAKPIPFKDERKLYRIVSVSGMQISGDQLIVWSRDPKHHEHVEQALAELNAEEITLLELKAKFFSVPRSMLEKISAQRKTMKVFQLKQVPTVAEGAKSGSFVLLGAETVSRPSMICEVVDEKRMHEIQKMVHASARSQKLLSPQIRFLDGQSVQIETKKRSVIETKFADAKQHYSVANYDVGFEIEVKYSESNGIKQRGMLDYQIKYSQIEGLKKQKVFDRESSQEQVVELPIINEKHFKDASLLKPGQVLLVGGLDLHPRSDKQEVLLVMLQVKKVKPLEENQVQQMHGVGVNSDAGVTGQIQLDESNFKERMVVCTYPVADLVIPVPPKFITPGGKPGPVPPVPQPRFEPLVDLIKQNVTPEHWSESQKTGYSIRAFAQTLSLVIRTTQETHDQIANLLDKIRAVQNRMLRVNVRFISPGNLHHWIEHWDTSHSEEAKALVARMKTAKLREGIIVNRSQASTMILAARKLDPHYVVHAPRAKFYIHRQTSDMHFPDLIVEGAKTDCHFRLHPVILEQDQVQIINDYQPRSGRRFTLEYQKGNDSQRTFPACGYHGTNHWSETIPVAL